MFIVSPSTLCNKKALETRTVPKRMIGRILLFPRRDAGSRLVARLIFEVQILRYLAALAPCVAAMFIWPSLALPISQAPIPMLFLIYFVETRVFNLPNAKREALISDAETDRALDALQFNAKRLLTRVAAENAVYSGQLHLVTEQSELGRVPVLTLVSIQYDGDTREVLDLTATQRAAIRSDLFDDIISEEKLHLITLREKRNLRSVTIEASDVSAHARMAARMAVTETQREVAGMV